MSRIHQHLVTQRALRVTCALFSISVLVACGHTKGNPTAEPVASLSPTESAAALVKSSMQGKFDTEDELAELNLEVREVILVHKSGNEYKGLATVRTQKGAERDVPVEVTYDGDNVLWESPPEALLFALEEQAAAAPPRTAAAPSPATGPRELRPSRAGLVYIVTKSGKTRCQISVDEVACQSPFVNPPYVNGYPANGMRFGAGGSLEYVSGDLGDIPVVPLEYTTYRALSWTIDATSDGTTFTHIDTGRSVFVSVTSVRAK